MIETPDIPEFLGEVEKLNPQVVHSRLNDGDQFSTHPYITSSSYRVDSSEVHKVYGFEDDFGEFLLELDRRLSASSPAEVLNHHFQPGKTVCDLSEVVRSKVGLCLEKAAIVALRMREQFLIKGLLGVQGRRGFHAFNVTMPDQNPHIADAQSPIIAKHDGRRIYYPFHFPLQGFDPDQKRFVFREPYEGNIGWQYYLPLNVRLP